jgi:sensor histidine kinase YesM
MVGLLIACVGLETIFAGAMTVHSASHQFSHSPTIWINIVLYLLISCILLGIYFTKRLIESERKQRELAETKLVTELAYLRSQIHPHFLFNTLNNIFSIAQRDQKDELADSVSKLSGMLRYLLYEGNTNRVSLRKELEHLKDFVGLAMMRYSPGEILLTFNVAGDPDKAVIAPMILLPFVENAFKHGVTIGKTNEITISIDASGDKIIFKCVNEKRAAPVNPESSGVGLSNVKRRIELLYPGNHELSIMDSEKYFEVKLTLT